jgi:hypothetical protein
MTSYQLPRSKRREAPTRVGRVRGGKIYMVNATPVRPSEGGMISENVTLELDPIAGRMITPIEAQLISIFAPVQALDALKNPTGDYPGLTEVVREKMLTGNPLFDLENENEITKRAGIRPVSIGGVRKTSEMVRLAYIAAVNFLRLRKYHRATLLDNTCMTPTPAIINRTILEYMNGVLDPDDRINGLVQFDLPDVKLPLHSNRVSTVPDGTRAPAGGTTTSAFTGSTPDIEWVDNTGEPRVWTELNGVALGGVSMVDFRNAETMDRLVRKMGEIVEANPQYGEEMVLRWAHGLSVDPGKTPYVLAERSGFFGRSIERATDSAGVAGDVMRSDMVLRLSYTVPVPKTELGGVVVTLVVVKPDETIPEQPHPIFSEPWGADNFLADELALDPVPVTMRQLDAGVPVGDESTVALYTGYNALKQTYVSYGLNGQVDPLTVENKTAIWQLEIPMSVTPDNILYPTTLAHYPFADQNAEVCTYTVSSMTVFDSPMIVGPTPVETLPIIGSADLFEEN